MILEHNEARRGTRTIIHGVIIIALLAGAYLVSKRIESEEGLREVIRWTLGIIGLAELGYQFENALRSLSLKGPGGTSLDATGGGSDDK